MLRSGVNETQPATRRSGVNLIATTDCNSRPTVKSGWEKIKMSLPWMRNFPFGAGLFDQPRLRRHMSMTGLSAKDLRIQDRRGQDE